MSKMINETKETDEDTNLIIRNCIQLGHYYYHQCPGTNDEERLKEISKKYNIPVKELIDVRKEYPLAWSIGQFLHRGSLNESDLSVYVEVVRAGDLDDLRELIMRICMAKTLIMLNRDDNINRPQDLTSLITTVLKILSLNKEHSESLGMSNDPEIANISELVGKYAKRQANSKAN